VNARASVVLLLSGVALTDLAFRVSQVAVPLVVLTATGSPASTGLAAGATGLPVLLSPWWARRARQRVRSGRGVAVCYLGEAVALAATPTSVALHVLWWPVLVVAGLGLGVAEALSGPGRDALVADLGDELAEDGALRLLVLRDFFRRAGMIVGPVLGGVAVAWGHGVDLLWIEVGCVLVSAGLAAGVATSTSRDHAEAPGIRVALRGRADVLAGWVVRGTGCLLWFGFTLGLSLLGADRGRPGVYLATAMTAYGIGSLFGTTLAAPLLRQLPVLPAICGAWMLTGLTWAVIGLEAHLAVIAVVAALSGATVVIGNAGVTAQITRGSAGADRRTLLAGQNVVVNAGSSAGLLVGGPVLAVVGPEHTLVATGAVTAVVALGVLLSPWARAQRAPDDRAAHHHARRDRTASAPSPCA